MRAARGTDGEPMATDQITSPRLSLVPLAVADADEMVGVLDGDDAPASRYRRAPAARSQPRATGS